MRFAPIVVKVNADEKLLEAVGIAIRALRYCAFDDDSGQVATEALEEIEKILGASKIKKIDAP